jgi:F0F1-type ATP synthase assembly protein I
MNNDHGRGEEMSSVKDKLRTATAKHMLIAVMAGMAFVIIAMWLYDRRYFTMPVFTVVATVITLGAAFLVPLLVTLNLASQKRECHDEHR